MMRIRETCLSVVLVSAQKRTRPCSKTTTTQASLQTHARIAMLRLLLKLAGRVLFLSRIRGKNCLLTS
jgi:hypothetical protein